MALLPHNTIQEAFALVKHEAQGTPFIQLVNDARADLVDHDVMSCHETSRLKDSAIMNFMQSLFKTITTGHPRPLIWTYIGKEL